MKINPAGGTGYIGGGYRAAKIGLYKNNIPAMGGDEAQLSSNALSFSKAMASARAEASSSADNLARIEEIRQQVQAGTYRVDSDKIADSILGSLYS
jgi:negative regulator of flagellin synthesis FlgM